LEIILAEKSTTGVLTAAQQNLSCEFYKGVQIWEGFGCQLGKNPLFTEQNPLQ
jgi:hypothetical protein